MVGEGGNLPVGSIRLRLPRREGNLYRALAGIVVRVSARLLRLRMDTLAGKSVGVEM